MNCHRVVNLMSAFVDGELTGAEMLAIRRHITQCPDCSEEYESLKMTKLAVARLRTVVPREDFLACIVRKLGQDTIPPYQRAINVIYRYAVRKLSPVAAALAVSGLVLAILAAGGQEPTLFQKPDVVAAAPLGIRAHSVSLVPAAPESPMIYSNTRPLVVAEHAAGANFYLAEFSVR
jgi:anti-sigma factor RsiW